MKTSQHVQFDPEELVLIIKKAALKKAKDGGRFQGVKKTDFVALAEVHYDIVPPSEAGGEPVVSVTLSCKDV